MKTLLIVIALFLFITTNAQTTSNWQVLRSIHVGGKDGWDYLEVFNGKIYLAHDSLVNVVDKASGDSVAVIPGTYGAHGIAFVPQLNKGFATAGRISSVIVFDTRTNKVIGTIKTAAGPDAIRYDPFSKKIFVCDGRGNQASIIDPTTNKVIDSVALQGKPEEPVSDEAGNIYVNIEDKNEVVHIDAKTWKILDRWKIKDGSEPSGLAMDRAHQRLFIGCGNSMMVVMNAANGKVVAELTTGFGCDGAAFDPVSSNAYSPNGEGTLTVIHEDNPDKFTLVANITTKKGARTIALDEQSHHLFLPTADLGETPPATTDNPRPRPKIIPGTFQVLEVGTK